MHTYYTALPFTPHDTCLYRLYEVEMRHSINVLQGLDPVWTSCLANLVRDHDASIVHVSIVDDSPDGTHLLVGGRDDIPLGETGITVRQRRLRCEWAARGRN